jgi:hypothetical protein
MTPAIEGNAIGQAARLRREAELHGRPGLWALLTSFVDAATSEEAATVERDLRSVVAQARKARLR